MSLALVLFDQFACYEFIKIKGVLRTAFDWDQNQPNYTGLPVEKWIRNSSNYEIMIMMIIIINSSNTTFKIVLLIIFYF